MTIINCCLSELKTQQSDFMTGHKAIIRIPFLHVLFYILCIQYEEYIYNYCFNDEHSFKKQNENIKSTCIHVPTVILILYLVHVQVLVLYLNLEVHVHVYLHINTLLSTCTSTSLILKS